MKTPTDAVIERLCLYMEKQNLTQYKLSQRSGIPFATLKSIMQHRTRDITLKTLLLLCDGLQVSISEFLDDDIFSVDNLDI